LNNIYNGSLTLTSNIKGYYNFTQVEYGYQTIEINCSSGNEPIFQTKVTIYVNEHDDNDGTPNLIDNCPTVSNPDQNDTDGNFLGDVCDNCPRLSNPDQNDTDGDGKGDVCEWLTAYLITESKIVEKNSLFVIEANVNCGGGTCGNATATSIGPRKLITISPPTPVEDYQIKIELNTTNFNYSAVNLMAVI
jgi:hypothetical protein